MRKWNRSEIERKRGEKRKKIKIKEKREEQNRLNIKLFEIFITDFNGIERTPPVVHRITWNRRHHEQQQKNRLGKKREILVNWSTSFVSFQTHILPLSHHSNTPSTFHSDSSEVEIDSISSQSIFFHFENSIRHRRRWWRRDDHFAFFFSRISCEHLNFAINLLSKSLTRARTQTIIEHVALKHVWNTRISRVVWIGALNWSRLSHSQ